MKDNVNIISYPKSGRTWLRALLGKYFVLKYNLSEKNILETHLLTKAAKLPIVGFTHDGSEWTTGNPPLLLPNIEYYNLPKDKTKYSNRKVVLLTRDIKDTLVSAYFQATKREDVFKGTMGDFIRSDKFGVKRVLTFYKIWENNQHIPKDILWITYEDMHSTPHNILENILSFIGEQEPSQKNIKQSIEHCSFQNLQKIETNNTFNSVRLQPGQVNDPESYKVRKGKVGGYVDYLSDNDICFIDQTIKDFK